MMRTMGRALLPVLACFVATHGAVAQIAGDHTGGGVRFAAQMTPSGRLLHQDEQIDRVYEAKSLREAQAAERARHQDAMEEIKAFQKRARERYNDDIKRCRDRAYADEAECMKGAATRHREASSESQRLHRREMDLYNHNLAIINRVWAPETRPRRDAGMPPPGADDPPLDARSRVDAQQRARDEARAAEAERRALYERDQRERERLLEQQRAFDRAQRQARQP
jgi:hypothetical protein